MEHPTSPPACHDKVRFILAHPHVHGTGMSSRSLSLLSCLATEVVCPAFVISWDAPAISDERMQRCVIEPTLGLACAASGQGYRSRHCVVAQAGLGGLWLALLLICKLCLGSGKRGLRTPLRLCTAIQCYYLREAHLTLAITETGRVERVCHSTTLLFFTRLMQGLGRRNRQRWCGRGRTGQVERRHSTRSVYRQCFE